MTTPRVGAVVVTYHPDPSVIGRLRELSRQLDSVCVVDNSPQAIHEATELPANITVQHNPANPGLAAALNQGIECLLQQQVESFFLFDQDSQISADYVQNMLRFQNQVCTGRTDIAWCAPDFFDVNSATRGRFVRLTPWRYQTLQCATVCQHSPLLASFAITSGSLFNRPMWLRLGSLRADLFIDHVDSEYCLRAAKQSLQIAINCQQTLRHAIGQRTVHRCLGVVIKPNHHPSTRRYYIARNGIHLMRWYGATFPAFIALSLARFAHELLSIVLYEQQRGRKLRYFCYGIWHGLVGRTGALPQHWWES